MAVGDAADRVAQEFDGRLGEVFIVAGRARLPGVAGPGPCKAVARALWDLSERLTGLRWPG